MTGNDPLDDVLDARLRDETPYIEDGGFTARVMQRLPARRASVTLQRSIIILVASVLSVVIAYFASGEGMFVHDAVLQLARFTPMQICLILLACGASMMTVSLWAAVTRARDALS